MFNAVKNKINNYLINAISTAYKEISHADKQQLKQIYGCQKGQVDFLVNNVFDYENKGLPRDGFFIDLAAADGVRISNTYFLERYLNWKGVLFEPNPKFHESILANRSAPLNNKMH